MTRLIESETINAKIQNNSFYYLNKKRNTIEISSSKALILIGNFINSKDINIKYNNKIINNSFVLWENEYNRHEIILPEIISFSNIQNKNINIPLYRDREIFRKEPFNKNLIVMDKDSDVESVENSILKDKEFNLKELNYGILSYQQKQNDLNA